MPIITQQDNLSDSPTTPEDQVLWSQCAGRHSPVFFRRLSSVKICAAFCGELIPALPARPDYSVCGNRARIRRLLWSGISKSKRDSFRLIQADSWSFGEAIACGAAFLHHDIEETGLTLPVSPVPFETYLPASPSGENLRLFQYLSDESLLTRIGEKGREWAHQHYSPSATAHRFLNILKEANATSGNKRVV